MDPLTKYKAAIDKLIACRVQVNSLVDEIKTVLAFLSSKNPPINTPDYGHVSEAAKKGGEIAARGGPWPSLSQILEAANNLDAAKSEAEAAYKSIPADQRDLVAKRH